MVFVIIGLSFFCVVVFFVLMIFLPEWVGISGKNSAEIRKEHEGSTASGDRDGFFEKEKSEEQH